MFVDIISWRGGVVGEGVIVAIFCQSPLVHGGRPAESVVVHLQSGDLVGAYLLNLISGQFGIILNWEYCKCQQEILET